MRGLKAGPSQIGRESAEGQLRILALRLSRLILTQRPDN